MPQKRIRYIELGAAAGFLGGFGLLADEVSDGDTHAIDSAVLHALRQPGNPEEPLGPDWFAEVVRDITSLGSNSVLIMLVAAIVAFLVLMGERRLPIFLTAAVAGGALVSMLLKAVFNRPRPDLVGVAQVFTASFPSSHATISAVVYLTLGALLADRFPRLRAKVFFFAFAGFLTIVVGLTRLYLGVHFPTDVIAGWSLGAAWALLSLLVLHYLEDRRAGLKSNGA